tara:strand:+ start:318 stop:590 length:273 start_codon:yes stop_codon:yes gene_type:complete
MPKYVYKCTECEKIYEVIHSFGDTIKHCSDINQDSGCDKNSEIQRIPQIINLVKKQQKSPQVGQIVDDYIKNTKKEVKEYKEDMINWKPK